MDNKVAWLVAVIATSGLLMIGPSWAVSDLDLTSGSSASYTNCITSLRSEAKDARLIYFNIPMLPAPSAQLRPKYLMVGLKSDKGTITMAIQRQDLYVLGYSDIDGSGKARAHFFQDVPQNVRAELFTSATIRLEMSFKSSYPSIESKAGVSDRAKFGLGIKKLASRVNKVYGADVTKKDVQKNQAEMFLIAIQIVCEAARFSYIDNQVKLPAHFEEVEFTPNAKFIRLENRWDKLSTAIRNADPKTKQFKSPVDLVNPDGSAFSATNVDQVKDDIALLKYVKSMIAVSYKVCYHKGQ